jgi:hypothetical protein
MQNFKAVGTITDRAKRYRANSRVNRPANPKKCGYCGSGQNVGVDHIDGNESHGEKQNLMWGCKSCNAKKSHLMRKARIGTLTRQYNPKGSRREQMQAYGNAIKVMRGEFEGDIGNAVATIKGTPASMRSAYTSRTWATRKHIYGKSGRANPGAGLVMSALGHTSVARKASAALSKLFKGGRTKNPSEQAEAMYELFHGMPSEEVIEIVERVHVHSKLTAMGTLTSMVVQMENGKQIQLNAPDPDTAKAADIVYVTVNETGDQIFFRGGDQEIPKTMLEKKGLKPDDFREHMIIGGVLELIYRTKKSFEKNGEELVDFYHTLGKEHSRGVIPMLVYEPRNPSMALYGGRYKVLPKRYDIGASPGIGG